MQDFFMTAGSAQGKSFVDPVFSVLAAAKSAIKQYGQDQVINASIGTIYDEEEKFVTLSSLDRLLQGLSAADIMDYAPISGVAGFAEAVVSYTFGASKPESYVAAIATPGGTGAIRNVFFNYAEMGSRILVPDWFWGTYSLIANECGRQVDYYKLFNEDNTFNLASLEAKARELLQSQAHLVVVINTPAHNPTGYSLTEQEWTAVLSVFRELAKDAGKRIVVLIDVAYMDYAGDPAEARKFFRLFQGLPENILITVAFSMSKSFFAYGLRCGALIAVSSSRDVTDEFVAVNAYSTRANWSNVTRLPQELLVRIVNDQALSQEIDALRGHYRELLAQRAQIFVGEAQEAGLAICPYHAGFFISVPTANAKQVCERLQQERIFVVPLKKGLRIAVCSVPTKKMPGLAASIKKALD